MARKISTAASIARGKSAPAAMGGLLAGHMEAEFALYRTIPNHAWSAPATFSAKQPAPTPVQPTPNPTPTIPNTGTKSVPIPPAQPDPDTFSGDTTGTQTGVTSA